MKAIQITSYDGGDGLAYGDVREPTPGPGQVSLDVEYAGANYVEALFAGGLVEIPLPWVPGIEASGGAPIFIDGPRTGVWSLVLVWLVCPVSDDPGGVAARNPGRALTADRGSAQLRVEVSS